MRDMLAASRAELAEFHTVGIVTAVLLGDVVTFFALGACQRDLGSKFALFLRHQNLQILVVT